MRTSPIRAAAGAVALGLLGAFLGSLMRRSPGARAAEERLHFQSQLLANVNDAVVAIDDRQQVIFWGPGAERLYGVAAGEALGRPLTELYTWRWVAAGDEDAASRALDRRGVWRGDNVHVLPSGREIDVESQVTVLRDAGGRVRGRLAVIRDATDRRRGEREQAANAARLRVALGSLDMAVFNQDRDLRYTWVYQPQLVDVDHVIGRTDHDILAELRLPGIERVIEVKRRVLDTGVGAREELRVGAGEDARWYDLVVEPIRDDSGCVTGLTAASLDVTERKRGEERVRDSREQLRALAARLQSVREEEKARIARDLHDELGQLLTGLMMQLRSLEDAVGKVDPENVHGLLDRAVAASALTDQTVATVKRIAVELRPEVLDRLGLVPALRQEVRRFQERTRIACQAELQEGFPEVRAEVATALYRICQEAMTNVSRHAGASRVAVRLGADAGRITLEIEDDGRGIEDGAMARPLALGLVGMVERARPLGGDVRIERRGARGTIVTASIPLGPAPRAREGAR